MDYIVVFLHGGPGGGVDPKDRQFFNPLEYKVCLSVFAYILTDLNSSH